MEIMVHLIYIYDDEEEDILIKHDGNLLFSKKDMLPLKSVKFYDLDILIPNNSDAILKQTYGDNYMTPRPKNYNWYAITNVRFKDKS